MNSLGKAALLPFQFPFPPIPAGLLLLATAANAALVRSPSLSLPLSLSSYSGLISEAVALGLFLGVLDGPGDASQSSRLRSVPLPDLVLVTFKAFPGEVGNDVRLGRRGLDGGIMPVMRKAEVEAVDGGVMDWSSEDEVEWVRDRRWLRLADSRSVSEPERTCSSSSRK